MKSSQTTYNKHYTEPEENFRYNIYLASKEGVETNNKLFRNGLVNSEQSLDQWADATLKEIAIALRADEWSKYKVSRLSMTLTITFDRFHVSN